MKRTLIVIAVLLLQLLAQAQHLSERVYVSTDRDVYVAGDEMFCSAFCFDMSGRGLSSFSSTVYIEISSPEGPVQTAKLALKDGRGAGVVSLLNTIPTGNYRMVAYTAQCFNEEGYDFQSGSRLISIINPFTSERASSGVEILADDAYLEKASGEKRTSGTAVKIEVGDALSLTNTTGKPVSVSLSMFHDDGIHSPSEGDIESFQSSVSAGRSFRSVRGIDYEGEVVRARVRGLQDSDMQKVVGRSAFLSVPGRSSSVFSAPVGSDGTVTFHTANIYGDVDVVLEVDAPELNCHLELEQPFASVRSTGTDALQLCRGLEGAILQRSAAMQILKAQRADTLYEYLPVTEDFLLKDDAVDYVLDDYTRFPLMEELFIEFVKELHAERTDNGRGLGVYVEDTFKPSPVTPYGSLVMIDGVPVLDQNRIFSYDPLLVEKISVYPHTYNLGHFYAGGIVDFVTYKKNLPSYDFPENARVISFQGVSYPVASYLPVPSDEVPDLRQTILWHPSIDLMPGETRTVDFIKPSYEGDFKVVVEGVDSDGKALVSRASVKL